MAKLFSFEHFNMLKTAIANAKTFDEDAAFDEEEVDKITSSFVDYAHLVHSMENSIRLASFRMEGAEFREYVSELDVTRRRRHEAAIANCDLLNKIACIYKTEKICLVDTHIREEVTNMCIVFEEVTRNA